MATQLQAGPVAHAQGVELTIVKPADLYDPAPNGYSHAVLAEGADRIAFIAGQTGEDSTGTLSHRFADQLRQSYANLRTALEATGAEPGQVARITTYVVDYDPSMLPLMAQEVRAMFGDRLPAQTLVPVPRLALDGVLFEVDAIAVLGRDR
ncbi:MAG: RidA family protein [Pseudomonadota bacterium]